MSWDIILNPIIHPQNAGFIIPEQNTKALKGRARVKKVLNYVISMGTNKCFCLCLLKI